MFIFCSAGSFRGLTAPASLKLDAVLGVMEVAKAPFRGLTAPASLKRVGF